MKNKGFKIGSKLYLHHLDGSIEGYTILDKESRYYIKDGGRRVYYEMLHLQPDNRLLADCYIEDYSALEEGLDDDDSRVIRYKETHKEVKMVSLDEVCQWLLDNGIIHDNAGGYEREYWLQKLRNHFKD